MATRLTHAAASAKQLAVATVVFIFIFALARYAWISVVEYLEGSKPTPPPATNVLYQVLPKLPSDRGIPTSGLRIRLNTPTGTAPIPTYTKPTVLVYRYLSRTNNFNYIINSQKIGQAFNLLNPSGARTSENEYTLTDVQNDVQMNINTEYFHYKYLKNNIPLYLPVERGSTISGEEAISTALGYIQRTSEYLLTTSGAAEFESESTFWYRDLNGTTIKSSTARDANITKVSLRRKDFQTIPFVTDSLANQNITFEFTQERAVSGGAATGRPRLISAEVKYWPVDQTSLSANALYPIRDITTAYNDLIAGKGFATSEIKANATYEVENAYLAYYEPYNYYAYVVPVWVFEGTILGETNSIFQAFVPAIAKGFIAE